MNTYNVTFKSNEAFDVAATDVYRAQEIAIETLEGFGIAHSEIVSINKVDRAPTPGQYVGQTPDGFAAYLRVSL